MLKSLLVVSLLAISTSAMAKSVDWTPYLKGMQNDCNTLDDKAKIVGAKRTSDIDYRYEYDYTGVSKSTMPKTLQPSVSRFSGSIIDWEGKLDIRLQNATFLGQPITRVVISSNSGGYGESLKVYFADSNFTKLKPKFYALVNNKKQPIGTNKYWRVTYSEKQDKYIYKSISKAQAEKRNNDSESSAMLRTHANGWMYEGFEETGELSFDVKNKSIECSSFAV